MASPGCLRGSRKEPGEGFLGRGSLEGEEETWFIWSVSLFGALWDRRDNKDGRGRLGMPHSHAVRLTQGLLHTLPSLEDLSPHSMVLGREYEEPALDQ